MSDIFSALKKCNQIGKKLSENGIYYLINGMLLAYDVSNYEDQLPANISVAFLDPNLINKLEGLAFIGLQINGNELYQISQAGEFLNFEALPNGDVRLVFSMAEADNDAFMNSFIEHMLSDGYNEETIKYSISMHFNNDIDIYEKYIKFKNSFDNHSVSIKKNFDIHMIKDENPDMNKIETVIDQLYHGYLIAHSNFSKESTERIFESAKPVDVSFKTESSTLVIRLMKSLCKIADKSSELDLRLVSVNSDMYLIVETSSGKSIINSIYKIM